MKNYSGPLRASLIASSIVSAAAAHAQNADGTDAGGLQEVTVTATRVEQVISKVPISISAFTQQQMEAQGVKQVDDLVRLTPGLTLQRHFRGFSSETASKPNRQAQAMPARSGQSSTPKNRSLPVF